MKIAIVGPSPPPNGGMAMQTAQLCKLLTKQGHEVGFIATNEPYQPQWVGQIVILRALFRLLRYSWSLKNQLNNYQVIHLMANSGWSFYLFSLPVIYVAAWLKIPVIVNYRGGGAKSFFARAWPFIKGAFFRVDRVIVPSQFLQQIFKTYDVDAKIIPNIIDLSVFEFKENDMLDHPIHVVVTRNLEPIYDNATAIKGFTLFAKNHPNCRLTVAGSGHEEAMLKQLVWQLKIADKVDFVGRISRDEIAKLYQSADILINSSLVDNTPNSLIEALACGLVVISSNVGGIPHLVKHNQHALLVEPKRADLIAQQLSLVVADPNLAHKLAVNGHQLVQQFCPLHVIPMLEQEYQELIKNYA